MRVTSGVYVDGFRALRMPLCARFVCTFVCVFCATFIELCVLLTLPYDMLSLPARGDGRARRQGRVGADQQPRADGYAAYPGGERCQNLQQLIVNGSTTTHSQGRRRENQ